jgi:uncharacterized protein (TIGR02271 family)
MKHVDGTTDETLGSHAEAGALTGALTGLGLGALAGLGVLSGVIPVVGPAIAAGTLGVVLSNAAAGAGIAGLVGALVGAGLPEHEAAYYQGEFEAGRTIVTVNADGRADEATAILRRLGAYDMSTRGNVATSPAASTSARSTAAAAVTMPVAPGRSKAAAGDAIEVKEERLRADKQKVDAGEVRVRKEVHAENKTIEVPVKHEEVVIERTAGRGRASSGITGDSIRAGEEIRIPVSEERVNVSKDTVVAEEVRVGKKVVEGTERVSGQVRTEEIKVEQSGDVDVRTRDTGKK